MTRTQEVTTWQRLPCTVCHRSYKFYCPKCNVPIGVPSTVTVPSLTLPLRVHVWFQDKIKKSTAPHAKVLAPQDVEIIPYPPINAQETLPAYTYKNTAVVYPSFEAETLNDMSSEELRDIRTLVFIDCPWQKASVIMKDPAIVNLRHVKLAQSPLESKFWRYHKAGAGCVSTIEAIQLMLEEYTAVAKKAAITLPEGCKTTQLSDLLFFFNLQFTRIVEHFENDSDHQERKVPMDADEKERRRLMYSQKEKGKKRRVENKLQAWKARSQAIDESRDPLPLPMQSKRHRQCYNCKQVNHHSKECPHPCRYCKTHGHFSANCSMKQAAYEREMKWQSTSHTKAL